MAALHDTGYSRESRSFADIYRPTRLCSCRTLNSTVAASADTTRLDRLVCGATPMFELTGWRFGVARYLTDIAVALRQDLNGSQLWRATQKYQTFHIYVGWYSWLALLYSSAVKQEIGRISDDSVASGQTACDLGLQIGPMADFDTTRDGPAILFHKDMPVAVISK